MIVDFAIGEQSDNARECGDRQEEDSSDSFVGATDGSRNALGVNEAEKFISRRFGQLPFTIQSIAPTAYPQVTTLLEFAPFTEFLRVHPYAEHRFGVANKGSAIVSGRNVSYRTVF